VVSILIRQLGRVLSNQPQSVERQNLIQVSKKFIAFLTASGGADPTFTPRIATSEDGGVVSGEKISTLNTMLKLIHYFDSYYGGPGRYDEALQIIESLQLIASSGDEDDLEDKVNRFERLDDSIKRNMGEVALSCMEIYYLKYQQVKQELAKGVDRDKQSSLLFNAGDKSRQKILEAYRDKARALVNFMTMTSSHIGADVNARLVRLETHMS